MKSPISRRNFLQISLASLATAKGLSSLPAFSQSSQTQPNIIIILADDLGFSDIGCYGAEIETPNLDQLAREGLRFTQFYNCAICSPTRAALLTSLYPHKVGLGDLVNTTGEKRPPAYQGYLSDQCLTIAEALTPTPYRRLMSGKWHLGEFRPHWPLDRGFEEYYGLISGSTSYFNPNFRTPNTNTVRIMARGNEPITEFPDNFYMTDAITDEAIEMIKKYGNRREPFFLYVAYTAPHWPLQSLPADIAKYEGKYLVGYEKIRQDRYHRLLELGLIPKSGLLPEMDVRVQPWETLENPAWEDRRMAVYAAQIESMDRGIGRLLMTLDQLEITDNTVVMFLSDNGADTSQLSGNNPAIKPGTPDTYMSYGIGWANVSNTPFKRYKREVYEGGIATPLIVRWPATITPGQITHQVGHVIDLMPTCLEMAGVNLAALPFPLDGQSLLPIFQGNQRQSPEFLYWECRGNRAIRQGNWKLVFDGKLQEWELYNLELDRTEINNLAQQYPERVEQLLTQWMQWATESNIWRG